MDDREFLRRARRYAKQHRLEFTFTSRRGKGSHGRVWVGQSFTTLSRGEIGPGKLRAMLAQLHLSKEDF